MVLFRTFPIRDDTKQGITKKKEEFWKANQKVVRLKFLKKNNMPNLVKSFDMSRGATNILKALEFASVTTLKALWSSEGLT